MKKLTILSATLLSSALILSACSSSSEKKEETNKQTSTSSSSETKATQAFDFTAMDKDGKMDPEAILKAFKENTDNLIEALSK